MTKGDPPAVILSGGRSSRMGFPKLLLANGDKPTAVTMIERLRGAGFGRTAIIISDNSLIPFIQQYLPDVEVIHNSDPDRGMISSLRLGIEWAGIDADGLLSWPIDHPLVEQDVLEKLRHNAVMNKVVIPTFNGRRGHPTWWGRSAWDGLMSSIADDGARQFLQLPTINVIEIPVVDEDILININTPEDAERFHLTRFSYEH